MTATSVLFIVIGVAAGFIAAWLARGRELVELRASLEGLQQSMMEADRAATEARTRLGAEREAFERERAGLEQHMSQTFQQLATATLGTAQENFLTLARTKFAEERVAASGDLNIKVEEIKGVLTPVQAELAKFQQAVQALQTNSTEGFTTLKTSLEQMSTLQAQLQQAVSSTNDATGKLRDALNNPRRAGNWGEIALDRIVEIAGMTQHCDFDRQTDIVSLDGTRERPDMTIRLTGNLHIPVDAKASVVHYLQACEATDEAERTRLLKLSAQDLRGRVKELQSRGYDRIPGYAGMTFLFVPNESMLSSALSQEPTLVEESAASRIIVCSPLLLVCYLQAFAKGWSIQKQQDNAKEVSELGASLHHRLHQFFGSLGELGKSLDTTVKRFNTTAGKINRLLVPGRELGKLLGENEEWSAVSAVDEAPRSLPYGIASSPDEELTTEGELSSLSAN